jgi:hypothetical protein
MATRYKPHLEVTRWSPNHSPRGDVRPVLVAVHATTGHNRPGVVDLEGLGQWFAVGSVQAGNPVSSHVATDNEGHSARFVRDSEKAWHVAYYNRPALGIEQVLPGDGTEVTREMLRETARWVAWWSNLYGIPIRKATVTEGGLITRAGVIRHSELGALGGNHSDPGPYDMHAMLSLARFYRPRQGF